MPKAWYNRLVDMLTSRGIVSNRPMVAATGLTDRWKAEPLRGEMTAGQGTSPSRRGPDVQATRSHLDPQRRRRLLRSARRRLPPGRAIRLQPPDRLPARAEARTAPR